MAPESFNPNSIIAQAALGVKYDPRDSFLAVMGVTGSGKSTFISRVVGGRAKIGHDLVSCTHDIESFSFRYNDTTIHLIDTPGFDDTYRTDSDVLKDIAFWLNAAYKEKIKLSGIVYLHPIDKNRMTGSAYKNIRMFHKLCGNASLKSVVLATTMWKHVDEPEGEMRQEQLKTRPDFWGDLVGQGSCVFRHDDTRTSAMNIITYIMDQHQRTVLQIQREMVDGGKTLDETSAGQELEKELLKQRELFDRRLKEAEEEMKEALEEGNRRAIEEAAEQEDRFKKKLDEVLKGSDELKITMEKLREQKDKEYLQVLENLKVERDRNGEENKKAMEKMEAMKQKMKERADETERRRSSSRKELDEMDGGFAKEQLHRESSQKSQVAEQGQPPSYAESVASSMAPIVVPRPTFEDTFGQRAAETLGDVVGMAALGLVATACNIM